MLECPICRQSFDGRIQILVPPHSQSFDSVDCARRAAEIWDWAAVGPVHVVEVRDARARARAAAAAATWEAATRWRGLARRDWAALGLGLCLFAAGTAAAAYLLARPSGDVELSAARLTTIVGMPVAPGPAPVAAPRTTVHRRVRRPAAKAVPPPKRVLHPVLPIHAGLAYEARSFPLPLRIRPPDDEWAGAQWTTERADGRPAFGWASLGRLPADNPRGVIAIETAFGPTPPAAAVLSRLRSGAGAVYGKTARVSLAGFPGWQFDGHVTGRSGRLFVPFGAESGKAPPDGYRLDRGARFRIVVLDVSGKSVVLFLDSFKLPPEEFADFLGAASQILGSLEFR